MDWSLRWPHRGTLLSLFALALIVGSTSVARALEPAPAGAAAQAAVAAQIRDFAVLVDGKRSGTYRMAVYQYANGGVIMQGQADVRVRYLIFDYSYTYRGRETWHNQQLVGLESQSDDGGQRNQVSAAPDGKALRVVVNGQTRPRSLQVWTSSFWRLPQGSAAEIGVRMLDVDNGNEVAAMLRFVEPARFTLGPDTRNCRHYRLSGGSEAELWYDDEQLLVRQETVEEGHKTVLALTRIAAPPIQQQTARQ